VHLRICGGSAEQPGQFRQPKPGELTDNPRYLSEDELEDVLRGFQQANHARNQGMVHLLSRWSLNVDVLHGLADEQREALMDNVEVVHVKAGQEVVVAGSVGTATTFWIVLSGSCCIWLPPLDSKAFAAASSESPVDTTSDPAVRAKESAKKWIKVMHDTHAQHMKLASLQRQEQRQQAADYAARFGGKWAARAAGPLEQRRGRKSRSGHTRRRHEHGPKLFGSLTEQQPKRVYVPGKGFKMVGKHTPREHQQNVNEKASGLVKNALEASRQEKAVFAGGKRAMDELTLSSKATTLLGDRELAGDHVEMTFPPFSCFGEKRAFYNADDAKVLETGAQSVQMTVRATKDADVKLLAVYRLGDIHAIMEAYQESMQDKIRFLRKMPQYKDKSDAELDKLAGFMRRTWAFEGDTIVSEGDEADSVYFVVSGQLSVTKAQPNGSRKVVNVLGAGASLGQLGVVQDDGKRAATCSALTDCELLVIHKYNFMRLSDPGDIKGIAAKLAEIARLLGTPPTSSACTAWL
jgi:CRP-like cAMP-binding protein